MITAPNRTPEILADGVSIVVSPPITKLTGTDTLLEITQFPNTVGEPRITVFLTPDQLTRLIDALVDAHVATKPAPFTRHKKGAAA